jgi:hypothetical protein
MTQIPRYCTVCCFKLAVRISPSEDRIEFTVICQALGQQMYGGTPYQ